VAVEPGSPPGSDEPPAPEPLRPRESTLAVVEGVRDGAAGIVLRVQVRTNAGPAPLHYDRAETTLLAAALVPKTKRWTGPKDAAAASPTKWRPGTLDWKEPSRRG
jgi:hypothetical protein